MKDRKLNNDLEYLAPQIQVEMCTIERGFANSTEFDFEYIIIKPEIDW